MHTRNPVERLKPEEAAMLRSLIDEHGDKSAARMAGPIAVETLRKAAVGSAVARLTVIVIRARLAVMRTSSA